MLCFIDFPWAMVFVVKSAISYLNRRKAIRHTWGNVKIYRGIMFQAVFVLGNSSDHTLMKEIVLENHIHGDILQVDLPDSLEYVLILLFGNITLHSSLLFREIW